MNREVKQDPKPIIKKEEKYLLMYKKAFNVKPCVLTFDNLEDLKTKAIEINDKYNITEDMEIFVHKGKVKILKKIELDV